MGTMLENLLAAEEAAKQLSYALDQLGWTVSEKEVYAIQLALATAADIETERIKTRILGDRVRELHTLAQDGDLDAKAELDAIVNGEGYEVLDYIN